MSDERPRRSLESLKKEAKRWLDALQANVATARERYARALGSVPEPFTLRHVQHALARELGFAGWTALRDAVGDDARAAAPALDEYEEKARALLEAYRTGTPDAMERHYQLTWHRRTWPAMRTYVQLDLGKRPSGPDDDVDITLDDARLLVAREHDYASWDALVHSVSQWPSGVVMTAGPVRVREDDDEDAESIITTRDWGAALRALAEHPGAILDAGGQMTDEMLAQVAQVPHVATLRLGNSKRVTDDGVAHLAKLPHLRVLDLSQTGVTDRGLEVLRHLPALESLDLVMTRVTDAGIAHVARCPQLRALNLMWTRTGDGALRALAGMAHVTHVRTGNLVTDAGLTALRDIPVFATWRGGDIVTNLTSADAMPNQLSLRGSFTDDGMRALRGLDGLFALDVDDASLSLSARAMQPLASLPNLGWLSADAKDDWMPYIAEMPALRHLGVQDTSAGDEGFSALSASRSIEQIWGRRCHNLRTRGFIALAKMPSLRALSVSCLNVGDAGIATLPDFPALRELMPMDVPDAGYRHIGKCEHLEALTLMYCRDTTDAATEHIARLPRLVRYFNSYTTITDRTPQILSTMDSLERITFDSCHNLTDAGLAALARLPRLKELRVSGRGVSREVGAPFPETVTVRYFQ